MADLNRYPPWRGDKPPHDNLAKVDDELWERHSLARLQIREETGIVHTVSSAWRDSKRQRELYECYIGRLRTGYCRCSSCNLAARPGSSNHERGLALDIAPGPRSIRRSREIYYQHGICYPVVPEDWHAEKDPHRAPLPDQPPIPPPAEVKTMHMERNHDGRLEEFDIYLTVPVHRWQNPSGAWSDWSAFPVLPDGQQAVDLAVAVTSDQRLEMVVKSGGGMRYRAWQVAPGSHWDQWAPA